MKEEIQQASTITLSNSESQTPLASNMLLMILMCHVMLKLDAKTAPGLHAQQDRPAKTSAGLSSTRATTSTTTMDSKEQTE